MACFHVINATISPPTMVLCGVSWVAFPIHSLILYLGDALRLRALRPNSLQKLADGRTAPACI